MNPIYICPVGLMRGEPQLVEENCLLGLIHAQNVQTGLKSFKHDSNFINVHVIQAVVITKIDLASFSTIS